MSAPVSVVVWFIDWRLALVAVRAQDEALVAAGGLLVA
jgi:hypothetical protein